MSDTRWFTCNKAGTVGAHNVSREQAEIDLEYNQKMYPDEEWEMFKENDENIYDLKSYEESLRGSLFDEEEIAEMIAEMKAAPVGTIKADCWEKLSEDEFEMYTM